MSDAQQHKLSKQEIQRDRQVHTYGTCLSLVLSELYDGSDDSQCD